MLSPLLLCFHSWTCGLHVCHSIVKYQESVACQMDDGCRPQACLVFSSPLVVPSSFVCCNLFSFFFFSCLLYSFTLSSPLLSTVSSSNTRTRCPNTGALDKNQRRKHGEVTHIPSPWETNQLSTHWHSLNPPLHYADTVHLRQST